MKRIAPTKTAVALEKFSIQLGLFNNFAAKVLSSINIDPQLIIQSEVDKWIDQHPDYQFYSVSITEMVDNLILYIYARKISVDLML